MKHFVTGALALLILWLVVEVSLIFPLVFRVERTVRIARRVLLQIVDSLLSSLLRLLLRGVLLRHQVLHLRDGVLR
ncbi:hypothetical protein [Burkholderia pseudomallei]|uniref:hypothetical protein n=1 Tax=Burkholderia pseudomallei TaxID=28450 RepID=UPI001F292033|nr:hypothetical protein [Burkholderia pseudomallei]